MPKFLTKEAHERFKNELNELKTVKRKEISERIRYTASFGDLKENFAYHEAKEAQGFLEAKIRELEGILANSQILQKKTGEVAGLGSTVSISSGKEKDEYQIVEPEESDILKGKISIKSPMGIALAGKKKGDKVVLKSPDGEKEYNIIKVD